jgi:peptidoglycan/xylan/chitin deacetylase (PgdA/CDA1 family)
MAVSRRAVLGLLVAGGLSAAAGCTEAVRRGSKAASRPGTSASASASGSASSRQRVARHGAASPTASATRGSTTPAPVGIARQVAHGPRDTHEVALTFHGAGDPGIARELLAIFAAHHAEVTVLAVGKWLHNVPHMAERIVAGGHELGNHTYHHLAIDELPERQARAEIVRCRDLLISLVGSGGAHFRQSQAQRATPVVRRLAGQAGYPICLSYDIDSLDYTDPGPAAVRANVARARAGSIVSMHFGHVGTVQAMPKILADFAARGLRPVTASTLLAAR